MSAGHIYLELYDRAVVQVVGSEHNRAIRTRDASFKLSEQACPMRAQWSPCWNASVHECEPCILQEFENSDVFGGGGERVRYERLESYGSREIPVEKQGCYRARTVLR